MTLSAFRETIIEDAHYNAAFSQNSPQEEFLNIYADALADAEELSDFQNLSFEGLGPRNKRIQIDGYAYDELEERLDIIVCSFSDAVEIESLTATDAELWFKRARAFVEESKSGFIQKNAEESAPGYGFAIDIVGRYQHVKKYRFIIVTDMAMSSRIKEIPASKIDGVDAEYHIWDIQRLKALQESKTGKEDITIDLTTFSEKGIPCLPAGKNEDYTAYLCAIPGKMLAELYNEYGGRLLEGNVRSFLTVRGKINKGIRNTILNEPTMFFAYNNGIAATAYDVKLRNERFNTYLTEITALQIVNGGQTTVSLATALSNDKARANDLKDIYVPMKLSVVSPEKALELIPNISKYANKQNKVSDADFFSNHPFHVRIEDLSRRVLAPAVLGNQFGTHWYYERARGQYRQEQARMTNAEKEKFKRINPPKQMFTKTDLAKYYCLYLQKPDQVSKGAQKNFIVFAEWASNKWETSEASFNESFFKNLISLNILFKKADSIIKNADWYEGYKAQIANYTVAKLFQIIEKNYPKKVLDLKSIWSHQDISQILESQLAVIAQEMNRHLTDPNRPVGNVSEWAKREDCWKTAKQVDIKVVDGFKEELSEKSMEKEEERSAKKEQKLYDNANVMVEVANYGVEKWRKVRDWGESEKILTPDEVSLLNTAIAMESGKFPSEKQCVRIMKILQKAREESYPE